jgi:hypothetical protein
LPKEQSRFREVDKDFRDIMSDITSNPRLVVLAQRKDLSNLLKTMLDQLGRCQKALNELLEVKPLHPPPHQRYLFDCFRKNVRSFLVFTLLVTMICWKSSVNQQIQQSFNRI